jgi:hypothetical protein
MIAGRASEITAGRHDEVPLREWTYGDVVVRQMPPDEHGVLRISVGGWPGPAYCVFRGDPDHCLELLHRAYLAMTNADPEDTDAAES